MLILVFAKGTKQTPLSVYKNLNRIQNLQKASKQ